MKEEYLKENLRMELIKNMMAYLLHQREIKPLVWSIKENRWLV